MDINLVIDASLGESVSMQRQKLMDKNFGLTLATFDALVEQLQQDDETLFEQVFLSHFEDCIYYLKKFCSATHEDAYDASMDALLDFCRRLKARKIRYGNLRFLFTRMAKQIYFKKQKKEALLESIDGYDAWEEPAEANPEDLKLLDKAWVELPGDCQQLLRQFYHEGVALKDIAEKMGKTPAAIRKQKQRCVEKLRTLFVKHI